MHNIFENCKFKTMSELIEEVNKSRLNNYIELISHDCAVATNNKKFWDKPNKITYENTLPLDVVKKQCAEGSLDILKMIQELGWDLGANYDAIIGIDQYQTNLELVDQNKKFLHHMAQQDRQIDRLKKNTQDKIDLIKEIIDYCETYKNSNEYDYVVCYESDDPDYHDNTRAYLKDYLEKKLTQLKKGEK